MLRVSHFNNKVKKIEGFNIRLLNSSNNKQVRSDRVIDMLYGYKRKSAGDNTVSQFLYNRLTEDDGIIAEVLNKDGSVVHGRTLLKTVRKTYE